MDIRQFHKRLFDAARPLIPPGESVVCAVSGGADSTAMLHALCAVNEMKRCRWRLCVAHVDHGLRTDSADDAAFVEALSAALSLAFAMRRCDVAAEARRRKLSIETAGRKLRYAALREMAVEFGASIVAVAHHTDDQAETVLHRICRGTGLHGLAGMRARRALSTKGGIWLVRPMLGLRRRDVLDYLAARKLAYRHDATNDLPGATRNILRGDILPRLEASLNPNIAGALRRLAGQAAQAEAFLQTLAIDALRRVTIQAVPGEIMLAARELGSLDDALASRALREALKQAGVRMKRIGQAKIAQALRLARDGGRRRAVAWPGGASIERRGAALVIRTSGTARRVEPSSPVVECETAP